jgi:hypothetical protein
MKHCPDCNRNYEDSQLFCLDDGAALVSDSSGAPATRETSFLSRRKSRIPLILSGLLLLGLAGTISWFLLPSREKQTTVSQSNGQTVINTPAIVSTPPMQAQTPTPFQTVAPSPSSVPLVSTETNSNVSTDSEIKNDLVSNTKDESNLAKPPQTALPVLMKAEDHSVLFAIHQCRKSGSSITCDFSLTNKGTDRRFELVAWRSNLYDELGNGYNGKHARLANQEGGEPGIGFISGVTTKAQVTFENIEPNASKITLLRIQYDVGDDRGLEMKFRNVPLTISK